MIAIRRPTWMDAYTLTGQFRASLEGNGDALGPIQVTRITTADVMQVLGPHWYSVPAAVDWRILPTRSAQHRLRPLIAR